MDWYDKQRIAEAERKAIFRNREKDQNMADRAMLLLLASFGMLAFSIIGIMCIIEHFTK